jgi:hypothetical protein
LTQDKPEPAARWHRDVWFDAIWADRAPKPNERIVAYVFARYAGKQNVTWCTWDELRRRTGIKSRDGVSRAISGLIESGWLKEIEKARQHRSPRYELTIPGIQQSGKQTSEPPQQSAKQTSGSSSSTGNGLPSSPADETSSPFPETRGPFGGPEVSNEVKNHIDQNGGHAAPRTPLREDDPSGRPTDQGDSLSQRGTDQTDLGTQPTTRASPENVIDFASRRRKDHPPGKETA